MKLLTEEQYKMLIENGQPENRDKDHPPVVKLYIPFTGCTWLLNEIEPETPNIAFGLCDLGMGFPEMGYVDLNEIHETAIHLRLPAENDRHFVGKYPLTVYWRASLINSVITEDENLLQQSIKKEPGYDLN